MSGPKFCLDVERYFYESEWKSMPEYEQNRCRNVLSNYSAMLTFGLNPDKPDFVKRFEVRRESEKKRNAKQIKALKCHNLFLPPFSSTKQKQQLQKKEQRENKTSEAGRGRQIKKVTNNDNRTASAIDSSAEIKLPKRKGRQKRSQVKKKEPKDENKNVESDEKCGKVEEGTKDGTGVSNNGNGVQEENTKLGYSVRRVNAIEEFLLASSTCSTFPTVESELTCLLDSLSIANWDDASDESDCSASTGCEKATEGDHLQFNDDTVKDAISLYMIMDGLCDAIEEGGGKQKKKDKEKEKEEERIMGPCEVQPEEVEKSREVDSSSSSALDQQTGNDDHQEEGGHVEEKEKEKEEEKEKEKSGDVSVIVASGRYPKRKSIPVVDYREPDDLNADHFIYCDDCEREWISHCDVHGPLINIEDSQVPIGPLDDNKERAIETLPDALKVAQSKIPHAYYGVWTTKVIPKRIRFGPYEGKIVFTEPRDTRYCWQIAKEGKCSHLVDGNDKNTSNWMRYVNCARFKEELNLFAYQYHGKIYYRTFKDIAPHQELLVWYGKEYAQKLGITAKLFNNPDMSIIQNVAFYCVKCNRVFTSPIYRDEHYERCHLTSCRRVYRITESTENGNCNNNNNKYSDTLKRGGNGEDKVKCNIKLHKCNLCDYASTRNSDLSRHMRTHTGEKPYKCNLCDYASTYKSNLSTHMRMHTGEKPYKCNLCDYASTYSNSLSFHMRMHTGEKPYKCNLCDYASTNNSHLSRHMRMHTGEKPYKCNLCDYASTNNSHLSRHMRMHTGEKPYKCNLCDYASTNNSHLSRHMRMHTGEKPYKCNLCDYASTNNSHLSRHMRMHTGEKPYKCNLCDYASTNNSHLSRHMRMHTGEKPYKCNLCDYASTTNGHLSTHMRMHTGEKPYKCNLCDFASTHSNSLSRHMRMHTGEKPYKCNLCDYASTQSGSLSSHMRVHTGEKPYKSNL